MSSLPHPALSESRITGAARLAGVIGWPVTHSRSPALHNHWLARYGLDGAYVPLPVAPGRLAEALSGLRACGFRGVNITLPHKEAAFALCDSLDDSARGAGAANTLVFTEDGRIHGLCTDGTGFLDNLRAHGVDPLAGPALILGAGGSARAIAAGLLGLGVPVTIANRTPERAEALCAALPGLARLDWADWAAALGRFALLVNTTSAGMGGTPALTPDLAAAADSLTVADIVYVPRLTPFLAAAEARGLRCVGGLGMLLHQARGGFSAWFGIDPVVDDALAALVGADIPER
ncbi:shikimate dehydrogenase [Endobacter medicaginis]|uniref:Shikimate dehydrogenase (NADP(+)) n=3 Tax=Endobacter medicaginis TaxID=1181271 RepID=A0A839UW57_9PROT|nr:shikimate dehydrogenase [Endobacter medicaginis]